MKEPNWLAPFIAASEIGSQEELADKIDRSRATVNRWANDHSKLNRQRAELMAPFLGVSVEDLMTNRPPHSKGFPPVIRPGSELVSDERSLPLYAAARGGDGHVIVTFEPIDYRKMPTILQGVRGGYGLLITGQSMVPAYWPGDEALVNPNLPPQRDTDVILYHTPPQESGEAEAIVKRLVGINDRHWTLEQYRPAETFKEARQEWPICHRVVGKYNSR